MKKIPAILSIILMASSLSAKEAVIRVGTFNLRLHNLDKGDNLWDIRKERVKQSFKENDFDICGLEEVSDLVQEQIGELAGDRYASCFFSPYHQDGKGNKACGFIYRKDRFKLLKSVNFWPCDTPETMTMNDHYVWKSGKVSKFKRGAIIAILKDRQSGKKFCFMISHGILNKESNAQFAHVYADMEKKYNKSGLPSFFVGDLNTTPDSPASETFRKYWKDSFAEASVKEGPEGTFNGFKFDDGRPRATQRIDFVYVKGKVRIDKYVCNTSLYDGLYASDHYPVYIEAEF